MEEIELTGGFTAIVDDEDYESLSLYKWHVSRTPNPALSYAASKRGPGGGSALMHRVILSAVRGEMVDHVNHAEAGCLVIDNRRSNLRIATQSQNLANQRKKLGGSSAYRGVYLLKNYRRPTWQAAIRVAGVKNSILLGRFRCEVYAAYAYDLAAVRLYGEFARTNFPVPGSCALVDSDQSPLYPDEEV